MKRREFCRTSVAASFAAAYPFLAGCGREESVAPAAAPTAKQAETGIAAISLDGNSIELERAAIRELGEACKGEILLAGQPGYDSARKVWNGMHDKHPALIARQIVYQLVEWIKGSPMSERAQVVGQQVGIGLLVLMMGVALFNDIMRQFG